ncbi:MAG: M67 family metallopeptidase [Deltaproteobacteria bacterium]
MSFLGLGKNILQISKNVYDDIIAHSKEAYPHECCGVIVGAYYNGKKVFESHRADNVNLERAADRYIIDPKEFNLIDKMARTQGYDVVGFYHSHPDHPDKPSATDREWGQVGYSYIIVSVKKGTETSVRCWTIEDDKEPFKEEKIKVVTHGA